MGAIQRGYLGLAAIALGAGFMVAPAKADVISYTLSVANSSIPGPAPYGTVSVDLFSSDEALITFTSNAAGGYYFLDSGSAGVNANGAATTSNITGNAGAGASCPTGGSACYSDGGAGTEDGFGSFSNTINTTDGFDNKSSLISFDLTLTSGTWADAAAVLTDNTTGYLAAAHIGQCNSATDCTAFSNTGYAANGPSTTPVPEPAAIALFGIALFGLGMIQWRRKDVA